MTKPVVPQTKLSAVNDEQGATKEYYKYLKQKRDYYRLDETKNEFKID